MVAPKNKNKKKMKHGKGIEQRMKRPDFPSSFCARPKCYALYDFTFSISPTGHKTTLYPIFANHHFQPNKQTKISPALFFSLLFLLLLDENRFYFICPLLYSKIWQKKMLDIIHFRCVEWNGRTEQIIKRENDTKMEKLSYLNVHFTQCAHKHRQCDERMWDWMCLASVGRVH